MLCCAIGVGLYGNHTEQLENTPPHISCIKADAIARH